MSILTHRLREVFVAHFPSGFFRVSSWSKSRKLWCQFVFTPLKTSAKLPLGQPSQAPQVRSLQHPQCPARILHSVILLPALCLLSMLPAIFDEEFWFPIVCVCVALSRIWLLWPRDCSPSGLSVHTFPARILGVGCCVVCQGSSWLRGSNPSLLFLSHW